MSWLVDHKKTIFISLVTVVQLILGFLLQIVIANKIGFSKELDIYLIVTSIGFLFVLVVDSAMIYGVTSLFTVLYKLRQMKKLTLVVNSLMNYSMLAMFIIMLILNIFIPNIATLINKDCCNTAQMQSLAHNVFLYYSLGIMFTVASLIGLALNYSHGRFYISSLVIVIDIVIQLAVVVLFLGHYGVIALALGFLAGQFLKSLMLLYPFKRYYKVYFNHSLIKRMVFSNILPLSLSSAYSNTSTVIDKYYASKLSVGSVSVLQYSFYLSSAVASILSKGLSIVSLNEITSLPLKQQHEIIIKNIKIATYLFLLYFFSYLLAGEKVLYFLFTIGHKIKLESVHTIYLLVLILSIQIYTGIVASILNNMFYSNSKIRLISKISIISQTANIFFKVFVFSAFGLTGLAWSSAMYYFFTLLILIYFYKTIYDEGSDY